MAQAVVTGNTNSIPVQFLRNFVVEERPTRNTVDRNTPNELQFCSTAVNVHQYDDIRAFLYT